MSDKNKVYISHIFQWNTHDWLTKTSLWRLLDILVLTKKRTNSHHRFFFQTVILGNHHKVFFLSLQLSVHQYVRYLLCSMSEQFKSETHHNSCPSSVGCQHIPRSTRQPIFYLQEHHYCKRVMFKWCCLRWHQHQVKYLITFALHNFVKDQMVCMTNFTKERETKRQCDKLIRLLDCYENVGYYLYWCGVGEGCW